MYLMDTHAEKGLFLAYTYRYMWKRMDESGEEKRLIDYKVVYENLRKDMLNAKRKFDGSYHYTVKVKMKIRERCEYDGISVRETTTVIIE